MYKTKYCFVTKKSSFHLYFFVGRDNSSKIKIKVEKLAESKAVKYVKQTQ